jgi:hypothetical protein
MGSYLQHKGRGLNLSDLDQTFLLDTKSDPKRTFLAAGLQTSGWRKAKAIIARRVARAFH